MTVELSDRGAELLRLLHMYWDHYSPYSPKTDTFVVEKALLCHFRYLFDDDELLHYDEMVDIWRKYHEE